MPSFVQFTPAGSEHPEAVPALQSALRSLWGFVLPVLLLLLAQIAAPLAAELPASLAGLRTWGPLMALSLAGALALAFNRGRVVFAVVSLTAAYAAYRLYLMHGLAEFPARTVFAAICLFVPLNLVTLSVLRERGVFTFYGVRRLGSIALVASLTAWVVSTQSTQITEWVYGPLIDSPVLAGGMTPQLALLLVAVGVVITVAVAVRRGAAIDAGFAGALLCFALACEAIGLPHHFGVYVAAAAATLSVTVVHDTFRLAFRDELTGLPSRRALNERLLALGPHFTVAMLDVDHFKLFNDRHGHDLGDQVLRMVATKLQHIGGGGRAYRYGGEEFTVLFAGRSLRQAWPHLEAARKAISRHPVVVRAEGRPEHTPAYAPRSMSQRALASVSVTVSIGVAERNPQYATAMDVLRAADKALYRAKQEGRDRVSK